MVELSKGTQNTEGRPLKKIHSKTFDIAKRECARIKNKIGALGQ